MAFRKFVKHQTDKAPNANSNSNADHLPVLPTLTFERLTYVALKRWDRHVATQRCKTYVGVNVWCFSVFQGRLFFEQTDSPGLQYGITKVLAKLVLQKCLFLFFREKGVSLSWGRKEMLVRG